MRAAAKAGGDPLPDSDGGGGGGSPGGLHKVVGEGVQQGGRAERVLDLAMLLAGSLFYRGKIN